MGRLPQVFGSSMDGSSTNRNYDDLLEQSASARSRGDHWTAQKLATEAHKGAMDERNRIQKLMQARKVLDAATQRVVTTRGRDTECTTDEELLAKHPEFKSVFTAWEKADAVVRELEQADPDLEPDPETETDTKTKTKK